MGWSDVATLFRSILQIAQERVRIATAYFVPDDELRSRAHQLAAEIAARRPDAIQGTVRAMWEARDLPPAIAQRHGLSYTQIGNPKEGEHIDSRKNKAAPRRR
jgi:enoyl-CoA hydratase/carnithine racemase